ncbi:MAG: GIY-YIG nuclease family protein [Bacillota bacterium]
MKEEKETHYTYIIQCADGTLYTGWTTDLSARMEAHNNGTGAKYTRGRGPVRLLYSETFQTKGEALRREHEIKKLKLAKKLKLIEGVVEKRGLHGRKTNRSES